MDASSAPRWSLAPGVFYRPAGPHVYVRNVSTRYDYLFNPMVKDILDLLRTERTKDELLAELAKTYALKASPDFPEKLGRFLESLTQKEVLVCKAQTVAATPRSPVSDAEGHAKGWYQKNFRLWNACFELTYLCNERCRHCYLDDYDHNREVGILRFPVWKKVIDEIADMGCMNVLVTGGEATLHPDFIEFCQHVVDRGMLLDIFTNALNIPDDLFDAIVALHPNTVSFSLYGGTPEFHDWVTQIPGSFERSLKTILMFKAAGVDIYIKSILFNGHADEHIKLKELARRLRIPLSTGITVEQGKSGKRNDLDPDDRTILQYFEDEARTEPLWHQPMPARDVDAPICGLGHSTLTFRPNGDISPCISFPVVLGNVQTDRIEDLWENSDQLAKMRRYRFADVSDKCRGCEHLDYCHVCPGLSFAETGRLDPCSYSCRHAKLKHGFHAGILGK